MCKCHGNLSLELALPASVYGGARDEETAARLVHWHCHDDAWLAKRLIAWFYDWDQAYGLPEQTRPLLNQPWRWEQPDFCEELVWVAAKAYVLTHLPEFLTVRVRVLAPTGNTCSGTDCSVEPQTAANTLPPFVVQYMQDAYAEVMGYLLGRKDFSYSTYYKGDYSDYDASDVEESGWHNHPAFEWWSEDEEQPSATR
jgi:hypothetical protein